MSTISTSNSSLPPELVAWLDQRAEPDREAVDENGYPVFLDDSDGVPLETYWHARQFPMLIEILECHRRGRNDFVCGGNMFIYFSAEQARNKHYRGPDFFLVNNVPRLPMRRYWAVWKENFRYPDLIIELMSPTTRDEDLTTKFEIYERTFPTREYIAYDPLREELLAWRKVDGVFQRIELDANGRVFSEEAGLYVGRWRGQYAGYEDTWLRFFDRDGSVCPLFRELEAARADEAAKAADEMAKAANAEKARADALAAELARLKAQQQNPA
jgi:Uma2 family endonuclease